MEIDFKTTRTDAFYIDGKKCRDVYNGGRDITRFLIKSNNESASGFRIRKDTSSCATHFRAGIDAFKDLIFRNEISFDDAMADILVEYYKKATGSISLNEFAKNALIEMLLTGEAYALVYTPIQETLQSAQAEKDLGVRPYVEIISADRIIPELTRKNEQGNITQIGIRASYIVSSDRYNDETADEIRVYFDNGEIDIIRDDEVSTFATNVKKLHIIQMRYGAEDKAPFINEANMQIQHYNLSSAKDAYNLKLGFPFPVTWNMIGKGSKVARRELDENGNSIQRVEFDANKGINFPVNQDTGAKLGDVEFRELSGSADAILSNSLKEKEIAIGKGFVKLAIQGTSNKTVEQSKGERAEGTSKLAQIATKVEEFLNNIHELFCDFLSIENSGYISVNREFIENGLSKEDKDLLLEFFSLGEITFAELVNELQNANLLTTLDLDEIKSRRLAEGKQ